MRKVPLLVGFLMLLSALGAVFLAGGPGLAVGAATGHGDGDGCRPVERQYGGCEGLPGRVAPAIVSGEGALFPAGVASSLTVETTGEPTPVLTESGALPPGVRFTDNGDGTATLAGTPSVSSVGVYLLTFTASNGVAPDERLLFTLKVGLPLP